MTEDRTDPRTDRADRAERALRAAFAEQTDGLDARPAAGRWVEEARRTARPRRPLVAAAAAVVL
ncbi:MAG TPA: hypothetical protein VGE77_13850, partial [Nocardioides sp.]